MRKGPPLGWRQIFRILRRQFRDPFDLSDDIVKRAGREVSGSGRPPTAVERNGDRQASSTDIEVLNNLTVGKSRGSAVLIIERHDRIVSAGSCEHQVGKKAEFFAGGHLRPGFAHWSLEKFTLL